jgi:hypothetical protein
MACASAISIVPTYRSITSAGSEDIVLGAIIKCKINIKGSATTYTS